MTNLMNGQKQRLGKATITWDGDQMPSIRFAEQCKGVRTCSKKRFID